MDRRNFLRGSAAVLAGSALLRSSLFAAAATKAGKRPCILLRGSWQSVNIGDIGHTPGAMNLIGRYFPEADVILWPGELGHGSSDLLKKAFPKLRYAAGSLKDGKPTTPELAAAWAEADFMLHGSGSGFGARAQLAAWHAATGKPYGVFGVSLDPVSGLGQGEEAEGGTLDQLRAKALALPITHLDADTRAVIEGSAFMFCRDSITVDYLEAQAVKCAVLEFGPDAQLGMELRDDAKGDAFLRSHELVEGKFICVIPRLRYTPYYRMRKQARVPTDDIRDAINNRTTEGDNGKLRELVITWVRQTGLKVLVCAEVTYQMELGKEVIYDRLPADVKAKVVWRDTFWLPDEAASIYRKAEAVVCMDCHSPLIAYHNGTPAFYLRQPPDTCKGEMYRDFGLADWVLEIEETTPQELWSRLSQIHADPAKARARVKTIMVGIEQRQKRMVELLRQSAIRA